MGRIRTVPILSRIDKLGFFCQLLIQVAHRRGIETNHMRKKDADGQPVRDAVMGGERIGAGVAGAQHRVFDGGAGPEGAHLHGAAGFQIGRVLEHDFQVSFQKLPGLAREQLRHRGSLAGDVRFQSVG